MSIKDQDGAKIFSEKTEMRQFDQRKIPLAMELKKLNKNLVDVEVWIHSAMLLHLQEGEICLGSLEPAEI